MGLKLGKNSLYQPREVIAIGDIHANFSKLFNLISKLLPLKEGTHLVFTGDLIDRGEDFFLVLDYLKNLKAKYQNQVFFLKGNHDQSLVTYLSPNSEWYNINVKNWLKYGGQITKDQLQARYGSLDQIKEGLYVDGYMEIFDSMLPYYETASEFISHAPIDPFHAYMYLEEKEKNLKDPDKAIVLLEGLAEHLKHKIYSSFTEEVPFSIPTWDNLKIEKKFISGHQSSGKLYPRTKSNRVFLDVVGDKLFAYSSVFGIIS